MISSPRATEMVQFARFPPGGVDSPPGARGFPRAGCPIRTSPDQRLPAAPRGVSPPGRVLRRPDTPRHSPCALASFHRACHSLVADESGHPVSRWRRASAIALRLVRYVAPASLDVESSLGSAERLGLSFGRHGPTGCVARSGSQTSPTRRHWAPTRGRIRPAIRPPARSRGFELTDAGGNTDGAIAAVACEARCFQPHVPVRLPCYDIIQMVRLHPRRLPSRPAGAMR